MASETIRPFKPDDLPAMQSIRAAAFAPVFDSFRRIVGDEIYGLALSQSEEEQAVLLDSICSPGSGNEVFVAEQEGALVGFVSFTLDAGKRLGEIGLNAVHPDHAGHGLGSRLYAFALARMKEAGMSVATVGVGGDPSHAPARRAYQKAGFGPFLPSHWMYKRL